MQSMKNLLKYDTNRVLILKGKGIPEIEEFALAMGIPFGGMGDLDKFQPYVPDTVMVCRSAMIAPFSHYLLKPGNRLVILDNSKFISDTFDSVEHFAKCDLVCDRFIASNGVEVYVRVFEKTITFDEFVPPVVSTHLDPGFVEKAITASAIG